MPKHDEPMSPNKPQALHHLSYRAKSGRLRRLRQAALDRDISAQRLIDDALDWYLDHDKTGEVTAESELLRLAREWWRQADDEDRAWLLRYFKKQAQ